MATGQPFCAEGYGDWNLENCGGGGGLSAAATDAARVLAALSVPKNNPMMSVTMLQTWLNNAANATKNLSGPDAHGYHGFDDVFAQVAPHSFAGDKGGSLDTSQNGVHFEINGISTVINWNGMTPAGPQWFSPYQALVNAAAAQNWGATDLFPTYGMPAFPIPRSIPIPIPRPPIKFQTPSHMLPQSGTRKNM